VPVRRAVKRGGIGCGRRASAIRIRRPPLMPAGQEQMPNILAMSFEGHLAPSFDLRCLSAGRKLPDGWGIGYYPGGEPSASVLKEPAPSEGSIRGELVRAWQHLESSLFIVHIRTAKWGPQSDANTQPFSRSWGARDWMIAHAGSLRERLPEHQGAPFQPVGSTDTEQVFCEILSRLASREWRSLADVHLPTLQGWFDELNAHGPLSLFLTDGRDLCVYADRLAPKDLFFWQLLPPRDELVFGDEDLQVDLATRGVKSRKGVVIASNELTSGSSGSSGREAWEPVPPGQMLVIRQGAVCARLEPLPPSAERVTADGAPVDPVPEPETPRAARRQLARAELKRLGITHRTVYTYKTAVERSTHLLRLVPMHDELQTLVSCDVRISVDGRRNLYEDVFGNRVQQVVVERPFNELIIEAISEVVVADVNPLDFDGPRAQTTIPLVWMPWQRHMLQPYLLPPELAESELVELVEYARSFVERNDYDLLDTLLDMNAAIHTEYEYRQGTTNFATTAFDVYATRRGLCQDFTNLFICLARLLGVPARYVCGYLYTGEHDPNDPQGQASHAWVQVYLPDVGWRGLDPTNGVITQTNHVRVAVGRSYGDATPTTGTLFVGGGSTGQTLGVDVRVRRLA